MNDDTIFVKAEPRHTSVLSCRHVAFLRVLSHECEAVVLVLVRNDGLSQGFLLTQVPHSLPEFV